MGKGENPGNQHFLLFPIMFSELNKIHHLNLSQTSPVFTCLQKKSFENTEEKEKLLVTSNFSFTRSVFYPFEEFYAIFIEFEIVVCKLSQFGKV